MTDLLQNGANATTIIQGIVALILAVSATAGVMALLFKKTRRLSKNLDRPLVVIATPEDDMDSEIKLLRDTGFFKRIESYTLSARTADAITGHCRVAVLRYSKTSTDFWTLYKSLRAKHIPVIVYAKPDEIDRATDHMARIQAYTYHTLCNTPTRLLSDVWAIMATYPEAKS